jgi:hypothetical protein
LGLRGTRHCLLDGLPILHTVEVVDFAGVSEAFAKVAKEKTRVLFER